MSARVGILAYQGCIEPHEVMLSKLDIPCERVRTPQELERVDRLIIPGGESTTMLRFLSKTGMQNVIREFGKTNPVWGICAGAILISRQVYSPEQASLDLIDIKAHRNFYGSQTESFTESLKVKLDRTHTIEAHYIRAPLLEAMPVSAGRPPLEVCATRGDQAIFFRQGRVWACSFHVELGDDTGIHAEFAALK